MSRIEKEVIIKIKKKVQSYSFNQKMRIVSRRDTKGRGKKPHPRIRDLTLVIII